MGLVMRSVVTGGAGFLGSHFCRRLLAEGGEVVCLDSLKTGNAANVADLFDDPGFRFERCDVTDYIHVEGSVDWVFHLASLASPPAYLSHPIHTLKVGAVGTLRAAGLAKAKGAGLFFTSTSEVYGDPQVHPQPETYRGNVNPVGPRGVYDESKRFGEAMVTAYHRAHGIPARIARIFNTYGPAMRQDDGRAVPTFIIQALAGEPLTIHGDGSQTRSLCFVDDLIEGFWQLLHADVAEPVNLGNPEEVTVLELAERVRDTVGSDSRVVHTEEMVDDPRVRCPDLTLARKLLGWEPAVTLDEGLERTVKWAREAWG
jgi:dTDP-glucose 4,6-dehydratase